MKKFTILLLVLMLILGVTLLKDEGKNEDLIRIHIRANSLSTYDQNISAVIRENVISYLADRLIACDNKNEAYKLIKSNISGIKEVCDKTLSENKLPYTAKILLREEELPERQYLHYTLKQGVYDSLTIELGDASGEDWWCVAYPPICFNDSGDYYYKSRLKELIKKYMPKS